jgi:hypothetical protein
MNKSSATISAILGWLGAVCTCSPHKKKRTGPVPTDASPLIDDETTRAKRRVPAGSTSKTQKRGGKAFVLLGRIAGNLTRRVKMR